MSVKIGEMSFIQTAFFSGKEKNQQQNQRNKNPKEKKINVKKKENQPHEEI